MPEMLRHETSRSSRLEQILEKKVRSSNRQLVSGEKQIDGNSVEHEHVKLGPLIERRRALYYQSGTTKPFPTDCRTQKLEIRIKTQRTCG